MLIVVANNITRPNAAAAGSGGGGIVAPNVFPNDATEGWTWQGATDTIRSGLFQNGGGGQVFTGANPMTWSSNGGFNGKPCATIPYVGGSGGGGADCFLSHTAVRTICLRWELLFTGRTGNFVKLMRVRAQGSGTIISTPGMEPNNNEVILHCDAWDTGSPDGTGFIPVINTWYCLRYLLDINNAAAVHQEFWVNNEGSPRLSFNRNFSAASPNPATTSFNFLEVDGTINPPTASGTEKISNIGVADFLLPCLSEYL